MSVITEDSLKEMETLLSQSAQGIHLLFDNKSIAAALRDVRDLSDFFDFGKMKVVQDVMTELITKKSLIEKQAYISELGEDKRKLLVQTYFHLVESNVRAQSIIH